MNEPLILDDTFQDILDQLENSTEHVFITGKAGTGKSTLLQLYRKTTRKKVVVLSPTGISALHVQGQTIHSFFQLPPRLLAGFRPEIVRRLVPLLRHLEVLIIDEISMVRADVMDAIDVTLRLHRKSIEPFGGIRIIMFGDLFQLPPVVSTPEEKIIFSTDYSSPYFFSAKVFREHRIRMIELDKVYRQKDRMFIQLLDNIRTNQADYDDMETLNERFHPEAEIEEPYLTLCTINATADRINLSRLNAIDHPAHYFIADVRGDFSEKIFPAAYRLELRKGAQVVFLRNDPEKRFVNGTLGTIIDIDDADIVVSIAGANGSEQEINLSRMTWDNMRYGYTASEGDQISAESIGSFTQYPVRLAWAITIHKSQGKTYDRVAIDLGKGAFEHGQCYVALSRCRTLEGVYLKRPVTMRDILVDEMIVDFYAQHR